jgi:DNA-binding PadR family transcriptional regulator
MAFLKKETLKEINKRTLKAFMDLAILAKMMERNPVSGYDITAFFHRKFSILLSSGTVYSVLYSMERDGLVEGMCTRRKRVYRLTEKGEKTIKSVLGSVGEIQSFIKILLGG